MDTSMYDYQNAAYHHIKDLRLTGEIIEDIFPDFIPSYNKYISGTRMYPAIYTLKEHSSMIIVPGFLRYWEYDNRRGQADYTGERQSQWVFGRALIWCILYLVERQ